MSKKLGLWEKMFPGLVKLEVKPESPDVFEPDEVVMDAVASNLVRLCGLFISQQLYADAQDKAERRQGRLNFVKSSEYWRGLADGAADAAYWVYLAALDRLDELEAGEMEETDRLAEKVRSVLESDARKAKLVPQRVKEEALDIPDFVQGKKLSEEEAARVLAIVEGGAA